MEPGLVLAGIVGAELVGQEWVHLQLDMRYSPGQSVVTMKTDLGHKSRLSRVKYVAEVELAVDLRSKAEEDWDNFLAPTWESHS